MINPMSPIKESWYPDRKEGGWFSGQRNQEKANAAL
jgi:hypothetical protein